MNSSLKLLVCLFAIFLSLRTQAQSKKKLKKSLPVIESDHGKTHRIGKSYINQETGDYEVEDTKWSKMDDHLYFNEKKWRRAKHKSLTKRKVKKGFRIKLGGKKKSKGEVPEQLPNQGGEFE